MKNRCQVFEKSIGLYIIVLITLFYSCAEDKGNYDYKAVNEVIVTGVTKDTSVMRGEVLNIHPVIGRSLQASEEGLEYSWSLAGKEIGTNRDLAYFVPETLNVGKYDCRYVVTDTKGKTLLPLIYNTVHPNSTIYSDEWYAYNGIDKEKFDHQKVYHKKGAYVIGRRSTNTIEGYWSHLKKMISGTHFWVSRKHLQRYVDCESFRYNTKHLSESERFDVFLQNTKRRLRYSQIN